MMLFESGLQVCQGSEPAGLLACQYLESVRLDSLESQFFKSPFSVQLPDFLSDSITIPYDRQGYPIQIAMQFGWGGIAELLFLECILLLVLREPAFSWMLHLLFFVPRRL